MLTPENIEHSVMYAVTLPTLLVAHHIGDHWIQTHAQAVGKKLPGFAGAFATARHVATYTATLAFALLMTAWALGLSYRPMAFLTGLAVTAVTHYWIDRAGNLERLADLVGKKKFAKLGDGFTAPTGTGRYSLDQAWHWGWLLVTALMVTN